MKIFRSRIALTLTIAALVLPSAAIGQSSDPRSLADTVDRLERQIQTLERTVYRGADPRPLVGHPRAAERRPLCNFPAADHIPIT